jgi:Ca2+/Na+ antiporter
MIASVTMARRGYGSMAVSNALGSQIINIAIGLGLPWLLATLFQDNGQIQVTDHNDIQVAAYFQFGAVFVNFMMLLGTAVYYKQNKALLTKDKGGFLVASYFGVIICYIGFMLYRHSGAGPCDAT